MDFLERIGDWFNALLGWGERTITGLFGSSNDRRISQLGFVRDKSGNTSITPNTILGRINAFEAEWEKKSVEELHQTTAMFRARLQQGETLDDLLPEAFAAVREAGKRFLKMRHYDVQMIGGYFLHKGMIAEMVTGEGKTLVSTLPAYLNALAMKVHVITVNDYLAKRDMEWMGPLHMGLGLTVGAIQGEMRPQQRQKEYACDITYGTNNEFGFDYLRDNMKPTAELQVQGPLNYALVDEIDNILIDEARTPLIISGPAHDDLTKYPKANRIVQDLRKGVDFEVKEKEHTCHLTEDGVRRAEELAGVESFYTAGNMEWPHLLDNALKAHYLYKRDVNYVVEDGIVVIVDEFTGRKMQGRQWSDGLHQAVEAKEGVKIKEESQTLATITLQNYFKLYKKLAGMTGTAMTEADEFWKIYGLDVVAVPTNRPLQRVNHIDMIYRTEPEKWNAVVDEVREVHETGRPILVGTTSIEQSEFLSGKLQKYGIRHNVLNAKYHEREAEIVAQAGRKNAVTISTNMAGRGTDIILGGNPEHLAWDELSKRYESRLEVSKNEWDELTNRIAEREGMKVEAKEVSRLGGLHVVGTERHDSRRIDNQLRGRAGRQGDPGSSRFFLSLEDKLMRLFAGEWVGNMLQRLGMQEGEPIESRMVSRRVEGAQKKVEERHFDQRKHLLEYDEVMDEQRKKVYAYRQRILNGCNCRDLILDMIDEQIDKWVDHFLQPDYRWETIVAWGLQNFHLDLEVRQLRDMTDDQLKVYLYDQAERQAEDVILEQIDENLPEGDDVDISTWNWQTLTRWANRQYGLNLNDRELKKIGREQMFDHLLGRAKESIQKYEFSGVGRLLANEFPYQSLCDWLKYQFSLELTADRIADQDASAIKELVQSEVREAYLTKEIMFPVIVGMTRFMSDGKGGGDRYDREGLARWVSSRFNLEVKSDTFDHKARNEVAHLLADFSKRFFGNGDATNRINEHVDCAFPEGNGRQSQPTEAERGQALQQLSDWANQELHLKIDPDDLKSASRDDARQKLLTVYDHRFRPELCEAERALLLEVLDTAWKDHLYYMGHVREGIGLVGYAQKDPKTEYKREGRRAFRAMWERIGEQVTSAIFRLENESPGFVGSLWQITATTHEDASTADYDSASPAAGSYDTSRPEPGASVKTIDPIVNRQSRVGRNDACPCGSGKKYKKCCGINE